MDRQFNCRLRKELEMKKLNLLLQMGFVLGAVYLTGCADKKIAEETNTDTSENIFTGSNTVTKDTETTYKNRKTGAVTTKNKRKETKYDKHGNVISESKELESEKD